MPALFGDRLFTALEQGVPAPGMLLVSAPGMADPNYERSVLLIVEHNETMTFAVDLTKRSEVAVFNVMPDWIPCVAQPQALYIGGPLNQQAVVGLGMTRVGVRMEDAPQLNRLANRLAHVDLRSDPEDIEQLVDGMRLFAGYSQWSPGQLDDEIARGDWFLAPALPSDVIVPARVDLYGAVMRRQAMPLPLFHTYPVDPSDN